MRGRTTAVIGALLCAPLLSGCIADGLPEDTREEKLSTLQRSLDSYWADAISQDPPLGDLVGRGVVVVPDEDHERTVLDCLNGLGFEATAFDGGYTYESPAASTVPPENLFALCFGRIVSESTLEATRGPHETAVAWAHQVYRTMPCLERAGYRLGPLPPLAEVLRHPDAQWGVVSELYGELPDDSERVDALLRLCPPYPDRGRPGSGAEP